jgi:hypothetical protein
MKLNQLAAVAALAAATVPAFATIEGVDVNNIPEQNNPEFVLIAWSESAQETYVKDLGLHMEDFIAGADAPGFSNVQLVDSVYSSSHLPMASDTQWAVTAYDIKGDLTPDTLRLITTLNNSFDPLGALGPGMDGEGVQNATASWLSFIFGHNGLGTQFTQANGTSLATPANGLAYYFAFGSPAGNFNGYSDFGHGNALGATSGMYYFSSQDQDFSDTPAYVHKYGVDVSFDGTTVSITSSVPEPESYAMLLAGIGAISLVMRRRAQR